MYGEMQKRTGMGPYEKYKIKGKEKTGKGKQEIVTQR